MKKLFYSIVISIIAVLISPIFSVTAGGLEVINNEIAGKIIYPSQWDIEVLDFSLISTESDVLNALTIRNLGLAPYSYLEEVVLYEDDGDGIFEGWQKDIEIGKGTYYDSNHIWYWQDLSIEVSKEGKRFFVAIETKRNANILVDRRTMQMGISPQYDENSDGVFDFSKDTGIFMASGNNGPTEGVLNSQSHTIHKKTIDALAPVIVITYPADSEEIAEESLTITGYAKDQGGSTPSWVKINISKEGEDSDIWNDVVSIGSNYATWEFNWANIEDGTYTIKTKSADWIENTKIEEGITVTVQTTIPIPPEPDEEEDEEDEEEEEEECPEEIVIEINDGDLIRAAGDYRVYIVDGNYKRWIQSSEIFNFYGHLGFAAVKEVSELQLESYTNSWLIRADGDKKVYEINADHTKHWLNITAEQFTVSGRSWNMVYVVNCQERDFYITGADVLK